MNTIALSAGWLRSRGVRVPDHVKDSAVTKDVRVKTTLNIDGTWYGKLVIPKGLTWEDPQ